MKATQQLHDVGQSLWLDNITREMLDSGQLKTYIDDYSVTGLTSNPSIFEKAIAGGGYDDAIAAKASSGLDHEKIFFELAVEDLQRAADLFAPVHGRTDGVDGFVSLEVSPELAFDTDSTSEAAVTLHAQADRPNVFIKIPGTPEGLPSIEESIFAGIPINVTLLFSTQHYLAAADAYLRGIERRVEAGLNPNVASVASLFMSRWDVAVADEVPAELKDRLAIEVGKEAYAAYRELMASDRVQRLSNEGARMQRLLWASTGTKDPDAPDTLYVEKLASPFTVNTMPENTLNFFYDHGTVDHVLPADGGDFKAGLAEFTAAGVDLDALAAKLQTDGAAAFVKSWKSLIERIEEQSSALKA
jgi:transaldolase